MIILYAGNHKTRHGKGSGAGRPVRMDICGSGHIILYENGGGIGNYVVATTAFSFC